MSQSRHSMLHAEDTTTWAITLSDLLMQLVAFALVAAAMASRVPGAPAIAAQERTQPKAEAPPQARAKAAPADQWLLSWDWPLRPRVIAQPSAARSKSPASAPIALDAPALPPDAILAPPWLLTVADGDSFLELTLPDSLLPVGSAVPAQPELVWVPPPPAPEAAPREQSDAPSDSPTALALARQLTDLLQRPGGRPLADVSVDGAAVVISLDHAISFASASAELRPDVLPAIEEIRGAVRAMPDFTIEVAGHADDRPIRSARFASNLELSLARAAAVAHVLTAGEPELADRVFAAGYGERRPRDTSGGEAARAHNRRVEIRLTAESDTLAREARPRSAPAFEERERRIATRVRQPARF